MKSKQTLDGRLGVVDLHHLAVWQAKERILNSLKILEKREDLQGLFLIHGFRGGTRIRDYIRNGPLKLSIKDRGINGKIIKGDGEGRQLEAVSLIIIQENRC